MKTTIRVLFFVSVCLFVLSTSITNKEKNLTDLRDEPISRSISQTTIVRLFTSFPIPLPDRDGYKEVILHLDLRDHADIMPRVPPSKLTPYEMFQLLYPRITSYLEEPYKFKEGNAEIYSTLSPEEIRLLVPKDVAIHQRFRIFKGDYEGMHHGHILLQTAISDIRNPVKKEELLNTNELAIYSFSISKETTTNLILNDEVYAILPYEGRKIYRADLFTEE